MEIPAGIQEEFLGPLRDWDNLEKHRAAAFNHVRHKYEELLSKYLTVCQEQEDQRDSVRVFMRELRKTERHNEALEAELSQLKLSSTPSNPFIFAIIDGDGAVFTEDLVAKGLEGGEEAAHLLAAEIKKHVQTVNPDAAVDRIVCQVAMHLEGLSNTFHVSNVLRNNDLRRFAQGFCRAQPFFSIVDVGGGKEQTDQKVRKMFELMQDNAQCTHIIVGPCHDNGYAPFLRPYSGDPVVAAKISLLEAVEVGHQFKNLNFARARFDNIFRNTNFPQRPVASAPAAAMAPPPGFHARGGNASGSVGGVSVAPPVAHPAPASAHVRSSASPVRSVSSSTEDSWATIGRLKSAAKTIDIAVKKETRPFVMVNRDEERLDVKLPPLDPHAQRRVMDATRANGANYCNRYHLNNSCNMAGDFCNFVHGERLTGPDLVVLKHMTRGIMCPDGGRCRDTACALGHHCSRPSACTFAQKCRFKDMHYMNMAPALKIFDDGSTELVS